MTLPEKGLRSLTALLKHPSESFLPSHAFLEAKSLDLKYVTARFREKGEVVTCRVTLVSVQGHHDILDYPVDVLAFIPEMRTSFQFLLEERLVAGIHDIFMRLVHAYAPQSVSEALGGDLLLKGRSA